MNKNLIREIPSLPVKVMESLASELGNHTDDINKLMELGGFFIEEVIDKDVESTNALSAFYVVEDSLRVRWSEYLHGFS